MKMITLFPNFKKSHRSSVFLYYLTQALYALCSSSVVDGIYRYPGETSPERVEMGIGESVNISCHMYPPWFPGKNSSDLYFVGGPAQEPVDENDIAIVNASTIVLMLRNATERQTSYICKIGEEAIMASKVNVGTAPKVVNDFNCRSYDLDYMLCNFTQPENPVLTQYNLTFHTISLDYIYQPLCSYEQKSLVVCNITLPQKYNPTIDDFHFTLKAVNALGTKTQHFNINIWNVMIPARPGRGFRINDISTDRLHGNWKMFNYNDRFKALQWEVLIKPENGHNASWLNTNFSVFLMRSKMDIRLRVYDLPFAFYWYMLRIRCRVRTAVDPDHMWSQPFFYHFQTSAKRPDVPPRVDVGSFYVEPTETQVRLYWEELPDYRRNGYNFSYKITEVKKNGQVINLSPLRLELNSAVFPWQRNAHYEFFIKSSNHIGESLNASRLEIMPFTQKSYLTHTPRPIHNVYDATNRSYTLSWEPPESKKDLLDYTVYWCHSKRALQNECKGSIHFKRMKKHELRFTTESQSPQEEHTLNMAVSANYLNYNTGMHWTPCTVDISSDLVKMSPEIQALSSSAVRIQLSPENVCPSILQGYNLTYCELAVNPLDTETTQLTEAALECVKPAHTLILNKNLKQYDLNGLKAYTDYRFEIFMFSRKKVGKSSDPMVVRTKEAAPSPPRQLTVYNITNTSATISWLSPSQPNGIIRYYIILLNNQKYQISANSESSIDADVPKFEFQFRNLSSFTSYKVYVVAHTVDNSEPSNDIHFSTLIGFPSLPRNIVVKGKNIIQWTKPLELSGRVDFYEVAVLIKRNDELIRKRISIVTTVTCELQEVPACADHDHKTTLEVRAINAALKSHEVNPSESDPALENWYDEDESDDLYEGNDDLSCLEGKKESSFQYYRDKSSYIFYKSDWQSGPTYGCATTRLSKITIIAFVVVVFSVTATIVIRNKYNKMANIDCALPAGLENYTRSKFNDHNILDKIGAVDEYSNKKLFTHNEKYHLLTPAGMDSTYFSGGGVSTGLLPLNEYLNSFDNMHKSLESSVNSTNSEQGRIATSLDPDQVSKTANSIESLNTENSTKSITTGDTSPSVFTNEFKNFPESFLESSKISNFSPGVPPKFEKSENKLLNSKSQCNDRAGGGYISVGSIVNASLLKNNYIQSSQAIQQNLIPSTMSLEPNKNECNNSSTNGCYIQFNNFNKNQSPINQETFPCNSSRDRIAEESGKIISGYVTQRDLTVFGQQRLY